MIILHKVTAPSQPVDCRNLGRYAAVAEEEDDIKKRLIA
jgi:hypothetical protein